jgi:hypothetical protein
MLKQIAQAIVLRAIGVIIALSLISAYAKYKENKTKMVKTARRATVVANKVQARTSVQVMEDLLKQVKNDITIQVALAADATDEARIQMKKELIDLWTKQGETIENGSIRDIYLTTVHNVANTAFSAEA